MNLEGFFLLACFGYFVKARLYIYCSILSNISWFKASAQKREMSQWIFYFILNGHHSDKPVLENCVKILISSLHPVPIVTFQEVEVHHFPVKFLVTIVRKNRCLEALLS